MATQRRNAKSAGRPIQYDRAAAIEAATRLFFEKGFRDTSVQDVVAATGMQTGSVYAAFGSKLELYLECLDADLSGLNRRVEELSQSTRKPLDALMAFWRIGQRPKKPSFAARALVDFTDRESEVWKRIDVAWTARSEVVHEAIRLAQSAGEIRQDIDAETLERHVSAVIVGSRFMQQYVFGADEGAGLPSLETVSEFLVPRTES